jgi:hypothetical protein
VQRQTVGLLLLGLSACRFDASGLAPRVTFDARADRGDAAVVDRTFVVDQAAVDGAGDDAATDRAVDRPAARDTRAADTGADGKCTLGAGWWDAAWRGRRKITVTPDPKDPSTVPLVDLPLPITLNLADYQGRLSQTNLRFVSSGVVLPHEVELWQAGQQAVVWVRVPGLAPATGGELWLYFDNPTASAAAAPTAVWSNGFVGVWHLQQPAGGMVPDSTSSPKPAKQEGTAQPTAQGRFGDAYSFDGKGWLRIASTASDKLALSGTLTIEGWTYGTMPDEGSAYYTVVGRQCGSSYYDAYTLVAHRGGSGQPLDSRCQTTAGATCGTADVVTGAFTASAWHHLAGVRTSTSLTLYVDGVAAAPKSVGAMGIDANDVLIGAEENDNTTTPSESFKGRIDEVRLSNVARTPSWIRATYRAGSDPAMVTLGALEGCP